MDGKEKYPIEVDAVEEEQLSYELKEDITKPFNPKKIDIQTKQMILDAIFKRIRRQAINLNTGFQRKGDLWDATKQSRLIESILIRFPLPAFYFDGTNDDHWRIVDGLQRLSTFKNFVIEQSLRLQNLEYLTQFNGKFFEELPESLQRRIEEHEITVYIINPGTPDEVKYNIFRRINTGGLILEPAEIRHALNQGLPAEFVQELAEYTEFLDATTESISTERMLDRDFVIRFLAFHLLPFNEYRGNLEEFLNKAMSALNRVSASDLENIRSSFKKAMVAALQLFDEYAFRKLYDRDDTRRRPLNKALFEVWSTLLARLTDEERQKLINKKDKLVRLFINEMNTNDAFHISISAATGKKPNVLKRFNTIDEIIRKTLEDD